VVLFVLRDAKSYAKYSAVDSDIDQEACHDLISGDRVILKGKKVMFKDLINEHQVVLASDNVSIFIFLNLTFLCLLIVLL
jgi:hypothetical protein